MNKNIIDRLNKIVTNTTKIVVPPKLETLNIQVGLKNKASEKTLR